MSAFPKYIFQKLFYTVLVKKPKGKRQLGRAKCRFLNGSERKPVWKVFWITVPLERDKGHYIVNAIMSPNLVSTAHMVLLD